MRSQEQMLYASGRSREEGRAWFKEEQGRGPESDVAEAKS